MIALDRSRRSHWALAVAGLAVSAALSGCCSDEDKKQLKDMVDRAIDRNFKSCEGINNETLHAQCIQNAQNQQTALISAYADYLSACATGDDDAIQDAIDILKQLLGSANKTVASAIGVVNEDLVLTRDESVCLSITMSSTGVVTPQAYVQVNQTAYLPEAAGPALVRATTGGGQATIAVNHADRVANVSNGFGVAPGSTICFNSGGGTVTGGVSGSFAFSSAMAQGGSLDDVLTPTAPSRFIPTAGTLTIQALGSTFDLTLDPTCPYNEMEVNATGYGTLSFRANFKSTGTVPLPARLPDAAWMVLPVWRSADGSQLVIDTGAASLAGTQVFPTLPNPIADVNRDLVVDASDYSFFTAGHAVGHPWTDVNHDGVFDSLDVDLFMDRWTDWSQP